MGTPWGPHSPSLKGWGIESQKTPGWGIWSPKTPGFRGGFRHFGGLEEMDLLNIDNSLKLKDSLFPLFKVVRQRRSHSIEHIYILGYFCALTYLENGQ